jgi:hypothetical protein
MFHHPSIMLALAKQHRCDLINGATKARLQQQATRENLARPAPVDLVEHKHVGSAGRLSVCDMPRELTAGRAR